MIEKKYNVKEFFYDNSFKDYKTTLWNAFNETRRMAIIKRHARGGGNMIYQSSMTIIMHSSINTIQVVEEIK